MYQRRGIVFGILFSIGSVWGNYQTQGFASFTEQAGAITFVCEQQCFILLGTKDNAELLRINGFQGAGTIAAGVIVNNGQITPLGHAPVSPSMEFGITHAGNQLLPVHAPLALIIQGSVKAEHATISLIRRTMGEKIAWYRNTFWTNEPLRPYSINLRPGVMIGDSSLVSVLYRLFVIVALLLLFGARKGYKRHLFLLVFVLIGFITCRNLWNRHDRTRTGLRSYTYATEAEKSFYDLGDYPTFIQKMRDTLALDTQFGAASCTIFIDAIVDRPFKVHANNVYIQPCTPAERPEDADYLLYYKKPIGPAGGGKQVLLDYNGSFLLRGK